MRDEEVAHACVHTSAHACRAAYWPHHDGHLKDQRSAQIVRQGCPAVQWRLQWRRQHDLQGYSLSRESTCSLHCQISAEVLFATSCAFRSLQVMRMQRLYRTYRPQPDVPCPNWTKWGNCRSTNHPLPIKLHTVLARRCSIQGRLHH